MIELTETLPYSWKEALQAELEKDYFKDLLENLDKEYQLVVRSGQIDQRLLKEEKTDRIRGAELLNEDDGLFVESSRILTDEDFKKIRRMRNKALMKI